MYLHYLQSQRLEIGAFYRFVRKKSIETILVIAGTVNAH